MWLSDRRRFLTLGAGLGASALLAGCNFTPVYAPGAASSKLENRIFIPEPTTQDLYQAVQRFEQKLGRASAETAPMKLTLRISKSRKSLGRTATGSTTRFHWNGILTFNLTNTETGEQLDTGQIRRFTAYSATGNIAATLAAERDATRRLMIIMTDALIDRILLIDPALLP